MKTSVVTCVWNRAEQAKYGLSSLLNQSSPPDQLIVVDDGSTDYFTEVIKDVLRPLADTKGVELTYIYLNHPEARISSFPRNIGLRKSRHPYVFFVEPEMLHVGDTMLQMKTKLEEKPRQVAMAGQIWTMGQRIWKEFHETQQHYMQKPELILTHPYAQLTDSSNMSNTKAPDSDFGITGQDNCFAGCFFGGKKSKFLKVRGFDESFKGFGWDDWDLIHRLGLLGIPHIMHNDIKVIHQWHAKNYPYNIYAYSDENGKISEERMKKGIWEVNSDNESWGLE